MNKRVVLATMLLVLGTSAGFAQKYTRQQQEAACSDDAFALCNDAVPDEAKVTACMIAKRANLSPRCRLVFDASAPEPSRRR